MGNIEDLWDYEPLARPAGKGTAEKEPAEHDWPSRSTPAAGLDTKVFDTPAPPSIQSPAVASVRHSLSRSILRRGHTVSYVGLFLFTLVLYFRPYELFSALSSLDKLAYWLAITTMLVFLPSQLVLEGNLTARPRA